MLGVFMTVPQPALAADSPLLANYYLDELHSSTSLIADLARYDLLVLTPAQLAAKPQVVRQIKQQNPDIIILAYVPSQSYNVKYWRQDPVFRHMVINDRWWLNDPSGNHTYITDDLLVIDMNDEWISYLISFINDRVATLEGVDGIFYDMVSQNISWLNQGNIDIEKNGRRTVATSADQYWLRQTQTLLRRSEQEITVPYIVTNGSSHPTLQPYQHGRMFETFPTPWEANGDWGTIMNNLARNKTTNQSPYLTILNGNTYNTGNNRNYQQVRFGLGSALLEDAYFSYDYGDQHHGDLWWYDEFSVDLGSAINSPRSLQGLSQYGADMWRRDFDRGTVIVNSSEQPLAADLGGEFEKLHGEQDPQVNDGRIVSDIQVAGSDGLILLKTTDVIDNVEFNNGEFIRFFQENGDRVRNGYFSFDNRYAGGIRVIRKDLNFDGKQDVLTITNNNKIEARRHDGALFLRVWPYTAGYRGTMQIAVDDIDNDKVMDIIVAPSVGYAEPIKVYSLYGTKRRGEWYPFGRSYSQGYDLDTIMLPSSGFTRNRLAITKRDGTNPEIYIYDHKYFFQQSFEVPAAIFGRQISVAGGDLQGDRNGDIVIGSAPGYAPYIGTYSMAGVALRPPFLAYDTPSRPGIIVEVRDVDFDGNEDIIGRSSSL